MRREGEKERKHGARGTEPSAWGDVKLTPFLRTIVKKKRRKKKKLVEFW